MLLSGFKDKSFLYTSVRGVETYIKFHTTYSKQHYNTRKHQNTNKDINKKKRKMTDI